MIERGLKIPDISLGKRTADRCDTRFIKKNKLIGRRLALPATPPSPLHFEIATFCSDTKRIILKR